MTWIQKNLNAMAHGLYTHIRAAQKAANLPLVGNDDVGLATGEGYQPHLALIHNAGLVNLSRIPRRSLWSSYTNNK